MDSPQHHENATPGSTSFSPSTRPGLAGPELRGGTPIPEAGMPVAMPKRAQTAPVAHGSPGVKSYAPRDIRDSLEASRWLLSARIEEDLLASAQEIASLPPEELEGLQEASKRDLDLSVLPLLPKQWQQFGYEVRNLGIRGLPHPSNLHLTLLHGQKWFWHMLHEVPVWLLHVPITPNMEPIPILVQSREKPCPGDNLVLASIHQVTSRILDYVAGGGHPTDPLEAEAEIQVKVMWAVIRAQQGDVEAAALGAIADRCFFRALNGSQFSLAPKF